MDLRSVSPNRCSRDQGCAIGKMERAALAIERAGLRGGNLAAPWMPCRISCVHEWTGCRPNSARRLMTNIRIVKSQQSSKEAASVFRSLQFLRLLPPIVDAPSKTMLGLALRWLAVNAAIALQSPKLLTMLWHGWPHRISAEMQGLSEWLNSGSSKHVFSFIYKFSGRSLNRCPTSIRKGRRANTACLFHPVRESPNTPQPSAPL